MALSTIRPYASSSQFQNFRMGLNRAGVASFLRRRDANMGVKVIATIQEIETEKTIARAYWKKNRPINPSMNTIGTNTANVATVPASTARATLRVPSRAAFTGDFPSSSSREIASTTTIASSTNSPIATVSASNVIILIVTLNR